MITSYYMPRYGHNIIGGDLIFFMCRYTLLCFCRDIGHINFVNVVSEPDISVIGLWKRNISLLLSTPCSYISIMSNKSVLGGANFH